VFLSKVRVRNFRNLRDFEIHLAPGLNVLVGENNIGKTNLLDAIRVALGSAASTGDSVRIGLDDRHRLRDGSYVDEPIAIDLTFADLNVDERAEFIDILNFDAAKPEASFAEVHFQWSWPDDAKRWSVRRTGGSRSNSEGNIPDDVLQALPITTLGALRDALVALTPGRNNRLGQLLKVSASKEQQQALEQVIHDANAALEVNSLITTVENTIAAALAGTTGDMRQDAVIRASPPQFDRIVSNLRLVLRERGFTVDQQPVLAELRSNGLGYNNLLYIATVLSELDAARMPPCHYSWSKSQKLICTHSSRHYSQTFSRKEARELNTERAYKLLSQRTLRRLRRMFPLLWFGCFIVVQSARHVAFRSALAD